MFQVSQELSRNVTELLRKLDWSQAEFARRLGSTQAAVSLILSGKRDPAISTIAHWAHVLGVKFTDLVVGPELEVDPMSDPEFYESLPPAVRALIPRLSVLNEGEMRVIEATLRGIEQARDLTSKRETKRGHSR